MRSRPAASKSSNACQSPKTACRTTPASRSRPRRPPAIMRPSPERGSLSAARSTTADMSDSQAEREASLALLSAAAVRARARQVLEAGLAGALDHFAVVPAALGAVADRVAAVTRESSPDLDVPLHSRWRHFAAGGTDRWAVLAGAAEWPDAAARARAAFDLVTVSVLLDAGAGSAWSYREPATGRHYDRSEGLAVASFDMFVDGVFSDRPGEPLRADAAALAALTAERLGQGFLAGEANPLLGLDGRATLLLRLGETVTAQPEVFALADSPRP